MSARPISNSTAKKLQKESSDILLQTTHFDKKELELLTRKFQSLHPLAHPQTGVERLDRQKFRDMLSKQFQLTESLLMDRIFRVFDNDNDNFISLDEFTKNMSIFLKGSMEEHIKYCFKVYDLNSDRYIAKEEMLQMLQHCLVHGTDEDEDGVKDIVDLVLKKLDEDRDGRVNEQDFTSAVSKDPLLLEVFGPCLPNYKDVKKFMN